MTKIEDASGLAQQLHRLIREAQADHEAVVQRVRQLEEELARLRKGMDNAATRVEQLLTLPLYDESFKEGVRRAAAVVRHGATTTAVDATDGPLQRAIAHVRSVMRTKNIEFAQRLFWVGQFPPLSEAEVRRAVDALEAEERVSWTLTFSCPSCSREWGGHPKDAPRRCPFCVYNHEAEEGPEMFIPKTFALRPDVIP